MGYSMTLREAAHDMYDHFRIADYPQGHPWIASIGEADVSPFNDTVRICLMLVRRPLGYEDAVPTEWQGYPVESRVIGRMQLC